MSTKIDLDELKSPDLLHSTSDLVFAFIERHFKVVLGLFALVVVMAVGYVVYGYIAGARENKAAEALYQPEAALKRAESKVREERAKKTQELAAAKLKTKDPDNLRPADYAKDYAPDVAKVMGAIRAHDTTRAAMVSALNLSYFLIQQKQFGDALTVLDLAKYHPRADELLSGFWFMHRGFTLIENKQFEPAMAAYQKVLSATGLKPFHAEALLKLGVCYELKGDAIKARETYERVGREFPETEASNSANQYLRLLELSDKKQG